MHVITALLAFVTAVTTQHAPHRTNLTAEGMDICKAPSTGTMRLWTDSRYRTTNIYIGGAGLNHKCANSPELTKLWVRTVTSNGWSLVPTYVGYQPPCGNPEKPQFTAHNARSRGHGDAADAVGQMKLLGMPRGNPVYVDVEPFDVGNARCTSAAVRYVSAFVRTAHHKGYRAGLYAHHTMGLVPLRTRTSPKPDDIWWANWNGVDSTSDPAVGGSYPGHRIHQYRGDHKETHHQQTLQIDNDAVHADVVGHVKPVLPAGPPFVYAASPPYDVDTGLRARATPHKAATVVATYQTGAPLPIECQTTGDSVYGDTVWDRLTDGSYVSDLYTTTTGRIGFTRGIPQCTGARAEPATSAVPAGKRDVAPAPTVATFTGEGFDKCDAPATGELRSWLGSPYRAVNIYFGGVNRACRTQANLTPQWVSTVTQNGWSIIPTFLGPQAPCQGYKTSTFSLATATAKGTNAADNAADGMAALGLGAGNPIYFDMEPYNVTNRDCRRAVAKFMSAWTTEVHARGYLSGIYAHPTYGLGPIINKSDPRPDDIWWPRYDGIDSTSEATVPDTDYVHHRIHQYANSHNETYNGVTFQIDNDAVDADVVGAVAAPAPTGPPYLYAASPPAGGKLRERTSPTTHPTVDNRTGTAYAYGEPLDIECQAVGETLHGSFVWDRLSDGAYVDDLNTTTTGGLTFTPGIPRCDTVSPTVTVATPPDAVLSHHYAFNWTGSDPDSGIASYQMRYGTWAPSGEPESVTANSAYASTSYVAALRRGDTGCVKVRAIDRSGNVSAWSAWTCTTRALDDRALVPSEGWTQATGAGFYQQTITKTVAPGARLVLHGADTVRVGVVATVCPRCGSVDVYVGKRSPENQVASLMMRSRVKARRTILLSDPFTARSGAVRLVTASADSARIDGLVVTSAR